MYPPAFGARMKKMSVSEFVDLGLLHEINRRLLHPLGLALEVTVDTDGTVAFGGVQDVRDDPEGMIFAEDTLSPHKAWMVEVLEEKRRPAREKALGYWIQPV